MAEPRNMASLLLDAAGNAKILVTGLTPSTLIEQPISFKLAVMRMMTGRVFALDLGQIVTKTKTNLRSRAIIITKKLAGIV